VSKKILWADFTNSSYILLSMTMVSDLLLK